MVSTGLLRNPEVKRWLAGVEPAWTLLEFDSLMALRKEPSAENRALRLAANLMNQDLLGSSIARNAVVLLDAAVKANGLKLTATGNLARSVVEEMRQSFEWPGHDKASAFALHKVVNEPDFHAIVLHPHDHAKGRSVTASQRQAPAHKLGARAHRPRSSGLAASDFVPHRLLATGPFVFRQGASRFLAAVRYGRRPLVALDGGIRLGDAGMPIG